MVKSSPPWIRRGGRDLKKNIAKHPCWERTGWFVQQPIIGGLNQPFLRLRAIALALRARLRELRSLRDILDRAATPPQPRRGVATCLPIQKQSTLDASSMLMPSRGGEYQLTRPPFFSPTACGLQTRSHLSSRGECTPRCRS